MNKMVIPILMFGKRCFLTNVDWIKKTYNDRIVDIAKKAGLFPGQIRLIFKKYKITIKNTDE